MARLTRGKDHWEITQTDNQLEITSNHKKTVRKFQTATQAAAQLVKLTEEQQQAGFAEVVSGARDPELERVIADAPDDANNYRVYADWLEGQGDPRGKLMALSLAAQPDDAAIAKAFKVHERDLLGPLAKYGKVAHKAARPTDEPMFGWRYGFIRRAYVNGVDHVRSDQVLEDLLTHPSGRLLVELYLVTPREGARQVIETLARRAPPSLRAFKLSQARARLDFRALWPKLPRLRRLTLRGEAFTFGEPELRELEELSIEDGEFRSETLDAIAQASWPALRKLELAFGGGIDVSFDELMRVLGHADLALTQLGIKFCKHGGKLVRVLPELPFARTLAKLDLSHCHLTDADANELVRRRAAFPALVELDVSANPLSKATLAALGAVVPTLRAYAVDASRRYAGLPDEP